MVRMSSASMHAPIEGRNVALAARPSITGASPCERSVFYTCFVPLIMGIALLILYGAWKGAYSDLVTREVLLASYGGAWSAWKSPGLAATWLGGIAAGNPITVSADTPVVLSPRSTAIETAQLEAASDVPALSTFATYSTSLGLGTFSTSVYAGGTLRRRLRFASAGVIFATVPIEVAREVLSTPQPPATAGGAPTCSAGTLIGLYCFSWLLVDEICVAFNGLTIDTLSYSGGCSVLSHSAASAIVTTASLVQPNTTNPGYAASGAPNLFFSASYRTVTTLPSAWYSAAAPITITLRSSQDPWVVAGRLTGGTFAFGDPNVYWIIAQQLLWPGIGITCGAALYMAIALLWNAGFCCCFVYCGTRISYACCLPSPPQGPDGDEGAGEEEEDAEESAKGGARGGKAKSAGSRKAAPRRTPTPADGDGEEDDDDEDDEEAPASKPAVAKAPAAKPEAKSVPVTKVEAVKVTVAKPKAAAKAPVAKKEEEDDDDDDDAPAAAAATKQLPKVPSAPAASRFNVAPPPPRRSAPS